MCFCVCTESVLHSILPCHNMKPECNSRLQCVVLSCLFVPLPLVLYFICFSSSFFSCFVNSSGPTFHHPFILHHPLSLKSLSGIGFKGAANQLLINTEFWWPFVCTAAPVCVKPPPSSPLSLLLLRYPSSCSPSQGGDE